jgi:hypothetical protein
LAAQIRKDPGAASSLTLKDLRDFRAAHGVKILGNRKLTRHEAQSLHFFRGRSIDWDDFNEGFSGLGDDE